MRRVISGLAAIIAATVGFLVYRTNADKKLEAACVKDGGTWENHHQVTIKKNPAGDDSVWQAGCKPSVKVTP